MHKGSFFVKRFVALAMILIFITGCAGTAENVSSGASGFDFSNPSEVLSSLPVSSEVISSEESSVVSSSEVSSAVSSDKASSQQSSAASSVVSSSEASSAVSSSSVISSAASSVASSVVSSVPAVVPGGQEGEMRGIWISFYELSDIPDFTVFKAKIDSMFDKIVGWGLNTVFMHVRSHGDAYYYSDIFPMSHRIGVKGADGKAAQGLDPGYDPLEYAVAAAHARGLELHAWLNPYRVWTLSDDVTDLAAGNPARIFLTDDDPSNDEAVVLWNDSIYYNPGSDVAIDLIIRGIIEIVENYDVDGIHFDDYFYPATDEKFDAGLFASYKIGGGSLGLADWRRENVNRLVRGVYSAVKARKDIDFGISPAGNINRVINTHYANVALWAGAAGYVDYIIPQIYWGFNHETAPFLPVLDEWAALVTSEQVRLYIGLPAYKLGAADSGAGTGKNEFVTGKEILARMVDGVRAGGCGGFCIYSYTAMDTAANAAEVAALADRLK